MKKILFTAALFALAAPLAAQYPATQDFSGLTLGELNTQGGWDFTGTNGTPVMNVTAGDVNITGMPTDSGDRSVSWTGNGQDVGYTFPGGTIAATDGTFLYASFAANITDSGNVAYVQADADPALPDGNAADDDYFFHFTEGTAANGTGFRARVFVDKGATGYYLGIRNTSGDPAVFYTTELPFGAPVFVVVKISFLTGNDTSAIFVNRVQASEPGSPDAIDTVNAVDIAAIGRLGVRADSTAETPNIQIDNIRVGGTWASVVPLSAEVSDWNLY